MNAVSEDESSLQPFSGYRRRIRIDPRPGCCSADLEDDFHRFGVTLLHDGETITEVQVRADRYPWTTCPAATQFLAERMRGVALAQATKVEDQRQHCTHEYDLFVLAARHVRDEKPTLYDIRVSDPDPVSGTALAEEDLNGETILKWRIGDSSGLGGIDGGDFQALEIWSKRLGPGLQEAARMLRRGIYVGRGRVRNGYTRATYASEVGMDAVCYTFQPERAVEAKIMPNNIRDFSNNPDDLLPGRDVGAFNK